MKKISLILISLLTQTAIYAAPPIHYYEDLETARLNCPHHIYYLQDQVLGHKGMMRFVSPTIQPEPRFVAGDRKIMDAQFMQSNFDGHTAYGYTQGEERYCSYHYLNKTGKQQLVWLTNL